MPQGKRTPTEQAAFDLMLSNINLLFLGAAVLILLDMSYMSRFWTQFEAWTSFQEVDADGVLSSSGEGNRRCLIECIHNANEYTKLGLIDMWSNKTPDEAYHILKRDDVSVTNQRDKEQQLPKIQTFKERVQQTWQAAVKERGDAALPVSRSPSRKGAVSIRDQGEPSSPSSKALVARPPAAERSPSFSPAPFEAGSPLMAESTMLLRAFEQQSKFIEQQGHTIEQQGHTIEQQGHTIEQLNLRLSQAHTEAMRLSQAHTDATSKAHTEFANAVSKQAELHTQLLADGRERVHKERQGR